MRARRPVPGPGVLAVATAALFASASVAHAQLRRDPVEPSPPRAASAGERGLPEVDGDCPGAARFLGDPLERAAFCAVDDRAFASARTLANRVLADDPSSVRAHYVLGRVQHRGEGNLPKALHHLERAEQGFVERFGRLVAPGSPPHFLGVEILYELLEVHGEMDHHEARIAYADALAERVGVDAEVSKAWPLVKLGRFDEAREVVARGLESDEPWDRSIARTALCAIESELRRREAAYEACRLAAEHYRSSARRGAVELTNAGAAAEEFLRFDEAERNYLEAATRPPHTTVNPWMRLVQLYLSRGRFSTAVAALKEMDDYRARRPRPYLDQQDAAESDLARAALALVLGFPEIATDLALRIVERPDRQGTSSAAAEQNQAGAAVFARAALLARARQLEALASVGTWSAGLSRRSEALGLRTKAWLIGRRALDTLASPVRLVSTLRPEVPGSLEMPGWLDAEIAELVGPGVAKVALERARAEETLPPDAAAPFFAAHRAAIAHLEGDWPVALEEGLSAARAAPGFSPVAAARAAAVAGHAADRLGRPADALEAYRIALDADPAVLLRLGLPLPVRVEADGADPLAVEAAERLTGAWPVVERRWGFRLLVSAKGARLTDGGGGLVTAVEADTAARTGPIPLAEAILTRLFMPRLRLTEVGAFSLQGATGAGQRGGDELKELLRGKTR